MKFKGQISILWVFLALALNLCILVTMFIQGVGGVTYVMIPVGVVIDILIIPNFFINYVEFDKKILVIHFGFNTVKIIINDIIAVQKTEAFFGTYALGSDKIALKKKNHEDVVISLKDNTAFIKELRSQNRKCKIFI